MTNVPASTPQRVLFPTAVIALAALGLAVRLATIAVDKGGGGDVTLYRYFADLMAHGHNPYRAPADGPISPTYSDMPPVNLAIFAAALLVKDTVTSLRILFALADFLLLLTIGFFPGRDPRWRLNLMVFYAFNPLILITLVSTSEDKVIILLALFLTLAWLEQRRAWPSILGATFLAVYKWMGVFLIAPLAIFLARRRRDVLLYAAVFAVLFAASHIPYFPDNLVEYRNREARTLINPPIHASITILLARAGLYSPLVPRLLIPLCTLTLYGLFFLRRIGIRSTLVLVVFCAYIWAPDVGPDRIMMITMPFFLIINLTRRRWFVVWVVTLIALAALVVNLSAIQGRLARAHPLDRWCHLVFGSFGSPQHAIWMNLLPAVMIGFYLADHWTGRALLDDLLQSPPLQRRQAAIANAIP